MTRQQNSLCELMLEFHTMCEEANALYFLIGPQLLHAAKDGVLHGYEFDVAMFWKDWKKIENRVHETAGREIESIADGGNLPGCYFRYVNQNTLLLDMKRYGILAKPGIGIHVHIIRATRKKSELLAFLEQGMEDAAMGTNSTAGLAVRFFRAVLGQKRFAARTLGLLKTVQAKKTQKNTELREPGGKRSRFKADCWKERTVVHLSGLDLYTMKDYPAYLRAVYGRKWKKQKSDAVLERYWCVFNPALPYARFMEEASRRGLLTEKFAKHLCYFLEGSEEVDRMNDHIKQEMDKSMFFQGEKFRLWKKYMPIKERILSVYAAGRTDEAEILMKDYLDVLNKYLKLGIVLCFDRELLDVAKKIYLASGKQELVEKINRCVLPEDLEPLRVTWKAGASE